MTTKYDRAVSLSVLSLIFSEMVQYQTKNICNTIDFELTLERLGRTMGTRVLEMFCYRDRVTKREQGVISILQVRSSR